MDAARGHALLEPAVTGGCSARSPNPGPLTISSAAAHCAPERRSEPALSVRSDLAGLLSTARGHELSDQDERYRRLLLEPIEMCADYTPKFGQSGDGLTLDAFTDLYGSDPLYSWIGLDSPLMYAAHKAGGAMTSIYRQLGIGCERLFRTVIQDSLDLSADQAKWDYTAPKEGEGFRTLSLDGRIDLQYLTDAMARKRVAEWLRRMTMKLDVEIEIRGAVFEVRQGYKSKDSKRQNADLTNAANAYTKRYLPVLTIMSMQLDTVIRARYTAGKWGVLAGVVESQDDLTSPMPSAGRCSAMTSKPSSLGMRDSLKIKSLASSLRSWSHHDAEAK